MRSERNSIGLEIDDAYFSMAAERLLNENQSLFHSSKIVFSNQADTLIRSDEYLKRTEFGT